MPPIVKGVLLAVVLLAAAYDLRFRRIPNWLTMSGVVLGLGVNAILFGARGFGLSALGLLCAFAVYLPLYLIRGMGAGDVKLMAAVGALVGPLHWLGIFLATGILGGVVAVLLILGRKRFHQTLFNLAVIGFELCHFRAPAARDEHVDVRSSKGLRLPHGAVIAGGCLAYLLFAASR